MREDNRMMLFLWNQRELKKKKKLTIITILNLIIVLNLIYVSASSGYTPLIPNEYPPQYSSK